MELKLKYIERAAFIWIYLAVLIFMIGFLKWYIALPACAAVICAMVLTFKKQTEETMSLPLRTIIAGAAAILVYMIFCGQCGIMPQLMDWSGRNAQLQDLISYSWPPYYSDGSAFTYYVGHFLFPAVAGKLFGLGTARVFLFLYTSIGMYLTWILMLRLLKARTAAAQIITLLLLMFFGNTEDLMIIVTNLIKAVIHIDLTNAIQYGFTPNFLHFAGVFNQVTCTFLVLSLFFTDDKRIERYFVIGAPLLLFSPFMMLAVIVVFATGAVKEFISSKKEPALFFKRLFSIENLCALFLAVIVIIYLSGNVFAKKPDSLSFHVVNLGKDFHKYIAFVLLEFGILSLLLLPRFKKDPYFYAANAILLILPFFKMGLYNDLVTRGSGVGLFILMLCTGDYILNERKARSRKVKKLVICAILLTVAVPAAAGCFTQLKDISKDAAAGKYTAKWLDSFKTYEGLSDRVKGDDLKYGYYTFDAKEHFFFKYMARE